MKSTPPKDTLELLSKHPNFFHGMEYMEHSWQRPYKKTIIIGPPRSGSTLLLRLLNMACLSKCVGDRPPELFEGIVKMYEGMMFEKAQYGHLVVAEEQGKFWDMWQGESQMRVKFVLKQLIGMIFGLENRSAYCKTTILGFGNELVVPVVQMLRELYEDDPEYELTIVWLKRDHHEIVESFIQKNKELGLHTDRKSIEGLLDIQEDRFKEAWQLGDKRINYTDLVSDPIKELKKCNPLYSPNERAVKSIMEKKLR